MKEIEITKGCVTIVDDDWYEMLSLVKWHYGGKGYAVRSGYRPSLKAEYMARIIIDAPKGMQVDHINRNKLDNRRENLRLCTHYDNQRNKPGRGIYSKHKGVSSYKGCGKYIAKIGSRGKTIYIGRFDTEVEAALAYDKKARELHGEFAFLNFPEILEAV